MTDTPTNTSTLAEQAYERLEAMIVTLALSPGDIFSEADLSRRIGIGRTPVREALQRLAAHRLVTPLPRKGIAVTDINIIDQLALLETRRVLDRLVAEKAAMRAMPDQRAALRRCAAALQQAAAEEDLAGFMQLDGESDAILEAASRNPFTTQSLAPLHAHCRRFWYRFKHDGDLQRSAALHAAVLRTVAVGDAEDATAAADALLNYLVTFTRTALDLY
jgi:DNA-binding GntR family transcriptional regulator